MDFAVIAKVEIPVEVVILAGKLPKKRKFNVLENVYKMQMTDVTLVQTTWQDQICQQKMNILRIFSIAWISAYAQCFVFCGFVEAGYL